MPITLRIATKDDMPVVLQMMKVGFFCLFEELVINLLFPNSFQKDLGKALNEGGPKMTLEGMKRKQCFCIQ